MKIADRPVVKKKEKCRGIGFRGKRCDFNATTDGYCKKHFEKRAPGALAVLTPEVLVDGEDEKKGADGPIDILAGLSVANADHRLQILDKLTHALSTVPPTIDPVSVHAITGMLKEAGKAKGGEKRKTVPMITLTVADSREKAAEIKAEIHAQEAAQ
jgi:hypothetical protein